MHKHPSSGMKHALLYVALAAALPASGFAQVRQVVSNQLAISEQEASLHLEFADQGSLDIQFRNGQVIVDDAVVGTYDRRDDLDIAWRGLLGDVVTLENGALARALQAWEPPSSLGERFATLAARLDEAIEGALLPPATDERLAEVDRSFGELELDLFGLLSRASLLPALAEALEEVEREGIHVYIEQDVVVEAGSRVDGTMLLVDGTLTIEGEVDGDVVVTEGAVRLEEGALVTGDLRLVDARLYRDGGVIEGRVLSIESDLESRLRDEIRSELRSELRNLGRRDANEHGALSSLVGNVTHGVAEVFEDLVKLFLLAGGSLLVVYLWKDRLNIIADTARRTPIRAGVVGLAGAFLFLPTWILGCVALVVSIVGILALPFWLLLFPVTVALAVGVGYLAVARNIGEWLADRNIGGLDRVRATNTFYAVVTGIVALAIFSLVANFLGMFGPVLGLLQNIVAAAGAVVTMAALLIGLVAVLLTRGWRQPEFYNVHDPFDADAWSPEAEVEVEVEEVIEVEEVREEPEAPAEPASVVEEPEPPTAASEAEDDDVAGEPEPVAEEENASDA